MLFDPTRHLPFKEIPYDENVLNEAIRAVFRHTIEEVTPDSQVWSIHPKDRYNDGAEFETGFYFGAAGVVWALHELASFIGESTADLPDIDGSLAAHQEKGENSDLDSAFIGELGIRFVKELLHPDSANFADFQNLVRKAALNSCREILYGGPGALAMAHFLWRRGRSELEPLCWEVSQTLLAQRELDSPSGASIWAQNLGGNTRKFVGAAHGNVGNWGVLLRVLRDLKETSAIQELIRSAEQFLTYNARIEGDLCNWSRCADGDAYSDLMVVHWCHGATGVLTDLSAEIPSEDSPELDELFLKGANLVWKAGPLEKGVSLCHGTAGSGLAMLKMFERTRDELWLDRARAFAMIAIEQFQAERLKYGRIRASLWTGDLGLAIFLRDLLRGHGTLPGLSS